MTRSENQLEELLATRALEGLTDSEAKELEQLGGADDDSFDLAAAAIALGGLAQVEPLPEALAAKVLAGARTRSVGAPGAGAGDGPEAVTDLAKVLARARHRRRRRLDLGRHAGWAVAVAAALVAFLAWNRPPRVVEKVVTVEAAAPAPRLPTPAERRAELLAEAPDAKTVSWSATPDPAAKEATGDVVWSESRQQGFMRIRGLAVNDPAQAQYQLWIFDAEREEAHPVDGGVFDVREGEVVVPIHAAVRVFQPKLFAVTAEKPGGVVVSKRERIVLTAAL